jgi:hypothetical protein
MLGILRGLQAFFWLRVFPAPKQNPRPPQGHKSRQKSGVGGHMNKTFTHLHAGILFSFIAFSALLVSCAQPAPTVQIINTPTRTSEPITIQMQTEPPTPPTVSQSSSLVFPHLTGDAGNFALLAGETITFTWENAPKGADKYEFALAPLNKEPALVLGIDFDDSDGVAISWAIPEHVAAELRATAYFTDGGKIETYAGTIYSGDFPPVGVCSLIARHRPVEVYRLPDRTAEIFALLHPPAYAHVLEIAPDNWYRIDASAAELYTTPPLSILPDTGFRDVAVSVALNFDRSPASGDGWVNNDKGVLLVGSCPP